MYACRNKYTNTYKCICTRYKYNNRSDKHYKIYLRYCDKSNINQMQMHCKPNLLFIITYAHVVYNNLSTINFYILNRCVIIMKPEN